MCPNTVLLNRLVGNDNVSEISIEGVKVNCLVDTGVLSVLFRRILSSC